MTGEELNMDVVERLRGRCDQDDGRFMIDDDMVDAAAEIEAALTEARSVKAAKVLLDDLTDALDPMTKSRDGASKDWVKAADAADEAPTYLTRPTAIQMIRAALRALAGEVP